jgi:hypothetical protein
VHVDPTSVLFVSGRILATCTQRSPRDPFGLSLSPAADGTGALPHYQALPVGEAHKRVPVGYAEADDDGLTRYPVRAW